MGVRGVGRPRVHRPDNWREVTLRWHRGEITAVAAMKMLDLPKSTFYRFTAEDSAGADMLGQSLQSGGATGSPEVDCYSSKKVLL